MQRRHLLRMIGGGAIAAAVSSQAGCSADLPPQAIAAWAGPAALPPGADPRPWILSWAILAPHSHNLQSWLVDLRQPDQIVLHLDRSRLLPETDPFSRQMMMSQGTFLELIDLAAREQGLRADITLFPEGSIDGEASGGRALRDRPTARIRLLRDPGIARDPLFAQIARRHTNREAYGDTTPSAEALRAIDAAAAVPGLRQRTRAVTAGDAAIAEHRAIARDAWRVELVTPRTVLESLHWMRVGPTEIARHRDGISVNAPLVRAAAVLGLIDRSQAPAPDSRITRQQIEDFNQRIERTPAFYAMVSDGNTRETQVLAGRAWVRVQLAATAQGLAMQPLQQALQEYPEQAAHHARIHRVLGADPGRETVQMWARLGVGPQIEPAPRRGLQAHLRPV